MSRDSSPQRAAVGRVAWTPLNKAYRGSRERGPCRARTPTHPHTQEEQNNTKAHMLVILNPMTAVIVNRISCVVRPPAGK